MAWRRPLSIADRVVLALVGLFTSGPKLVLGLYGWGLAADIACHGGYECPF